VRGLFTLLFLLLLVSPFVARAEEEEEKKESTTTPVDLVKALPKCLRPGVTAVYARGGGGGRIAGTVTFKTAAGDAAGTVKLILDYDTGDRGVLTLRDRLTAVLDAKTRTIVAFEHSVGGAKKDAPYLVTSRLRMETDPKKKPGPVHERYTYRKKGEKPTVKRTRPKLPGAWMPEPLEPFLVPLLGVPEKETRKVSLMTVLTGTIGKKKKMLAEYRRLGEGVMRIGGRDVGCLILSRMRDGARSSLYLRSTDSLPVKAGFAWLTLKPAGATGAETEKKREGEK